MADHHEHGSMDISTQERTFETFLRFVAWGGMIAICTLVFMALVNA